MTFQAWVSSDEGYSRNVPDEGFSRNVPDEGYSRNVPDEGYSRNVPDDGYYSNVPDECYSRNAWCTLNMISRFYFYHWVDTSAGGLYVPGSIIRTVVNILELWNLQFLNSTIIITFWFERIWWRLLQKCVVRTKFDIYVFIITKALLSHEYVALTDLLLFWLGSFSFVFPKMFYIIWLSNVLTWA